MLRQYIPELRVVNQVLHLARVLFHIDKGLAPFRCVVRTVLEPLASDHAAPTILGGNIGSPFADVLAFCQWAKAFSQEMGRWFNLGIVTERWKDIKPCRNEILPNGSAGGNAVLVLEEEGDAH